MPNNKSRKNAPERAREVVAEWVKKLVGRKALSVRNLASLRKLVQASIAHADAATLKRDDRRDSKWKSP